MKEPQTFDEQIQRLKGKNIVVNDDKIVKCFLQEVNYYRLSGYFLPYMRKGENTCFKPIEFEKIKAIYDFDSELRNIIVAAIEKIEIYLRTQFAYYHAMEYGALGYENEECYNDKHNSQRFNDKIKRCIKENSTTQVVKHHMKNYDGKFPIWVIIEFYTMGMLSYFYKDMLNKDKAKLAKEMYNVNYQVLESWLRCITDLRNRCAHYSRLYYWVFSALPKMPTGEDYVPTRRLFAQLYVLKMMYPDHSKWNEAVLKPMIKLIKKYDKYISRKHMDFPYRWKSMLRWQE